MKTEPNSDALGIPTPSPESCRAFADQIYKTNKEIRRRFGAPNLLTDLQANNIICLSFLLSPLDEWKAKFSRIARNAIRFYRTPEIFWKTLEAALLTPEVAKAYKKINPAFHWESDPLRPMPTPATQKITPQATPAPKKSTTTSPRVRRGLKWRLNNRWNALSPLDRKIFFEGCRRAQKPKREGGFWWAELGVESLSKKTWASPWHVKRSRFHLCELGLWARIKRGYLDQGASKYHVFFTPKMADRFFWTYRHKGKPQGRENPIVTLRQDKKSPSAPYPTLDLYPPR